MHIHASAGARPLGHLRALALWGLLLTLLTAAPAPTHAVTVSYLEGLRPVAPDEVTTLGPDLFGDRVNLFNGSLEFEQTDLSVPGNNVLPVALGRRHTPARDPRIRGPLGDWDLDLPSMGGVFLDEGWLNSQESHQRCSVFTAPPHRYKELRWMLPQDAPAAASAQPLQPPVVSPTVTTVGISILPTDYWQGTHLSVPGQGQQEVLLRHPAYNTAQDQPEGDVPYRLVTHRNWQIRCLASVLNGPGEGFVAVSPEGVTYHFNWMVSRWHPALIKQNTETGRAEFRLFATKVADRFGNWVEYAFDPGVPAQLNRIHSSDGRSITLTWSGGLLRTATDGTRLLRYLYDSEGRLQHVVLPDNTRWTFDLGAMRYPFVDEIGESATCDFPGVIPSLLLSGTMTHPSGARGQFDTAYQFHGRTGVLRACYYAPRSATRTTGAAFQHKSIGQALQRKTISGPGLEPQVWSYSFGEGASGWDTCTTCPTTKPVLIVNPDGHMTRLIYGISWRRNEGQLLQQDDGYKPDGTSLRRTRFRYRDYVAGSAYPEQFGGSLLWNGDFLASRHRPQDQKVVEQDGATFTWQVLDGPAGFDRFARPRQIHKYRGLGNGTAHGPGNPDRRIELLSYFDHRGAWVLGQPLQQVDGTSGVEVSSTEYDPATALPVSERRFGRVEARFEFRSDGTLKTHFDAGGRGTGFNNHRRGAPQEVVHADGTTERQEINNLGKPLWIQDEVGATHRYTWDASGRLTRVEYPTGDPVAYHPTLVSLAQSGVAAHGLPVGHWKQVSTTGNARTERYFDALFRERLRVSWDESDPTGTRRVVETRYDLGNRKAWQGYPARDIAPIGTAVAGIATIHDAIGRPTLHSAHSELGMLQTRIAYLPDFRKRVTNPRGFDTVFAYQAFDTPNEDSPRQISLPEAVTVDIQRDAFGKPTAISRGGAWGTGTLAVTRRYVYDAHHRLCKTIEPESGATVQQYDASGNLAWRASGLPLPGSACDWGAVPAERRIQFAYDLRDRLTLTTHGDGSGSIARQYHADGQLKMLTASRPGTNTVAWAYQYNQRRLLTQERYEWGDPSHGWVFEHGIDAHGHVSSLQDPWGLIDYAPNALGQPTRAGSYAHSVRHHPNGMVESYTLGNGKTYAASFNARGLPARVVHGGILSDRYAYDANGNVAQIVDELFGRHRSMPHYDGLDRLRRADGPWGSGLYTYDPIDNLVASTVGARTLQHRFDPATNRLTSIEGSLNLSIGYDANGNVASRGSQTFGFDIANRMLVAHGTASYVYDGHGRRNLTWFSDGTHRHEAYTRDGKLRFNARLGHGTRRFVYLADKLIAETADGGVTTYRHADGLGSPVATTNATGAELAAQRLSYEPYGSNVAGSPTPYGIGFTGHVNDADTGLVYMQQRYYDPLAGRFLSVDPVSTDARTGGHFNRYVYGNNNPYRYVDPDGRVPVPLILKALDVAVTVAEVAAAGHSGGLGAALKAGGETLISSAVPGSKVFSAASRYSRAAYGYRSGSATAKAVRQGAEGAPCPRCGQVMISGTKTAPQVQHEPALSVKHYEGGGSNMTASEKKVYANSEASMNGANCAQCQKQEGGAQRQYVEEQEKLKKSNE